MPKPRMLPDRNARVLTRAACLALATLSLAPSLPAQRADPSAPPPAQLLNRGMVSYNAGKFADSEAALTQFLALYGGSKEAREFLPRILPVLAIARIQQRKFAEAVPGIRRYYELVDSPPPRVDEELSFWLPVCRMQLGETEEAARGLGRFIDRFPRSAKVEEAILLVGTAASIRNDHAGTVEYFSRMMSRLSPVNRGRAIVLQLHALVAMEDFDRALELIRNAFPHSRDILQIVAFQTLSLQTGTRFFERGEYRKAIACFQRVWSRKRLMDHQEEKLAGLEEELEAAQLATARPFRLITLGQMVAKVKREIGQFRQIEHFDSALRLRMASAFQRLERYREAALVMEDMLRRLPPDPVVEQASLNLVRCWIASERWDKAVEAAETFESRFPDSEFLPQIVFMRGEAFHQSGSYGEAVEAFARVAEEFPGADLAARAHFMSGFCLLLDERHEEAVEWLAQTATQFPGSKEVREMAEYWQATAFSLLKEFARCRERMQDWLETYPDGRYRGEAVFRRAYCAQSMQDFALAIRELRGFLETFPHHARVAEARLLLGDALMATGEVDKGIVVLKSVPPESTRFFEEAWFKVGKAFRLQEKPAALRNHMRDFINNFADSPRVPEAVYWIGWTHRQEGNEEAARSVYWKTIEQLGNDPARRTLPDLFSGLNRLHSGAGHRRELLDRLEKMEAAALAKNQTTLAMRARWAQATALRKSDPAEALERMRSAANLADIPRTAPALLADFGEAHREAGDNVKAKEMFEGLRKWNPRAVEKDRAFAGLGWIALEEGDDGVALRQFDRFQRETPDSPLLTDILVAKSRLLADRGAYDAAAEDLEQLLENPSVPKPKKVEALYELGTLQMRKGAPKLAVPYFQRIYVMYGRWSEFVAKSYLQSGIAFEQLERDTEAAATYREMLARSELEEFDAFEAARARLRALEEEDAG